MWQTSGSKLKSYDINWVLKIYFRFDTDSKKTKSAGQPWLLIDPSVNDKLANSASNKESCCNNISNAKQNSCADDKQQYWHTEDISKFFPGMDHAAWS